jgi:serine/threonine protein kinase
MQEIAIMKRCHHKHVVKLIEVIDDAKSKKIFMGAYPELESMERPELIFFELVLEYMSGGQIEWQDEATKTPKMTVDEARRVFRDVVLGLGYRTLCSAVYLGRVSEFFPFAVHYQGVIHRDIKPANLLWETPEHQNVKISDFGVSHLSEALARASSASRQAVSSTSSSILADDDRALRKTAGSPAFFAPELCFPAESTPIATPMGERAEDYFAARNSFHASVEEAEAAAAAAGRPASGPPRGRPTSTRTVKMKTISPPLPSYKARERPKVGPGIDVWALGVTLYCLLFGRTPFEAQTEYELYNIIPWCDISIPETMGADARLTGSGQAGESDDDSDDDELKEGREVMDLLGRLLEKDPKQRITLAEVKVRFTFTFYPAMASFFAYVPRWKKHPWVLRNLDDVSAWLRDTDPTRDDMVIVNLTAEDVQKATASRQRTAGGSGIRASIRRAIAKIGLGGGGARTTELDRRPRSKSVSSATGSVCTSVPDGTSESGQTSGSRAATRQSSIAGGPKSKGSARSTSPPAPSRQPSVEVAATAAAAAQQTRRWSIKGKLAGSRREQTPRTGPKSTPMLVRSQSGSSRLPVAGDIGTPHLAVPSRLPGSKFGSRPAFSESVPSSPRPSIFRPELSSPPKSAGSSDTEAGRRSGFGRMLDGLRGLRAAGSSSSRHRSSSQRDRRLTSASMERYEEYSDAARAWPSSVSTGSSSRLSQLRAEDDPGSHDFSSEEAGEENDYRSGSSESLSDYDDYGTSSPVRKEDRVIAWNSGGGWHYAPSEEAILESGASSGTPGTPSVPIPMADALEFGPSPFESADARRFMSIASGRRASVAGGRPGPSKSSLAAGPHVLRNAVSFEGTHYYSGDDEDEHEEEHEIEVRPRRRRPTHQQVSGVAFRPEADTPPSPSSDRYVDA